MKLIFLTYTFVMLLVMALELTRRQINSSNNIKEYNYNILFVLAFGGVLIFVSAFRYKFIDTTDYRLMYEAIGPNIENVFNDTIPRIEKGYLFITYLLNCINTNSQFLLIVTSVVINIIYIKKLHKYSKDVPFSLFLYFVLSYMGTMNGLRQTLAASIAVLFFEWIVEKKTFKYLILILLLSLIHKSVLICIPVYFIVKGKFFNKGVKLSIIFSLAMLLAPGKIILLLEEVLGDSGYASYLASTEGMSGFRFLVSGVPILLIVLYHFYCRDLKKTNDDFIVMQNLCIVNFAIGIMALKILFFGRITMYFNIYSLILIPTLIRRIFKSRDAFLIKTCAIILYSLYFAYQIRAYGGYMNNFRLIF